MTTTICGIVFNIKLAEPILANGNRMGECDLLKAEITINKGSSAMQFEATLIHEWMHAVAGCNGTSQDEGLVSVVAQELFREGFRVPREGSL